MEKVFLKTIIENEGKHLQPILEDKFENLDLKDLIDWGNDNGYIDGILYTDQAGTKEIAIYTAIGSRVTMKGKLYLKNIE